MRTNYLEQKEAAIGELHTETLRYIFPVDFQTGEGRRMNSAQIPSYSFGGRVLGTMLESLQNQSEIAEMNVYALHDFAQCLTKLEPHPPAPPRRTSTLGWV